ncbi:MAG: hypothetical protein WD029_10590 [Microthrixaceae bacterium]
MSKLNPGWSRANGLIAIFFIAAVALGIGLILIDKQPTPSAEQSTTEKAQAARAAAAKNTAPSGNAGEAGSTTTRSINTLPLDDLSVAAISKLSGLNFPTEMTDFLTARGDTDRQLDLTFVMPSSSAATFLADSGLPEPIANKRLVFHSSPLWKVNPEDGSTLSSSQGKFGKVKRAVELVGEEPGFLRARIAITPS